MTTIRVTVAMAIIGLAAAACSSSPSAVSTSSSEVSAVSTSIPATTAPTTTPAPVTTVTTTTATPTTPPALEPVAFATFADAAAARLTSELGDASVAGDLVARLGSETLSWFEAAIGITGAAESLLLTIAPPTVDASSIDSVVVYAFGNQQAVDGTLSPGPMNEALAAATASFVAQHPVPVYAQWEVADLLVASGVPDVESIGREVETAGNVTYLSTAGVAAKAIELAASDGRDLGQVGVIGFADHAVRCVLTSRAAGMTADVPAGLLLPSVYDPESGQPWTRNRLDYLAVDLPARLAVWPSGAEG